LATEEIDYHAALVEAIAAGDPVAAESAAADIVNALKDVLLPKEGRTQ
jgi:DNA-binding FadR family transcriptional regulator